MNATPSNLEAQIDLDLKQAMRDRDETVKLTLRAAKTAINQAKKEEGAGLLDEEDLVVILNREAKRRRDAAAEYEKAGSPEKAAAEMAELAVLERYLPAQMTEEEIAALAQRVIDEVGATSMRDMGAVMSAIMPQTGGRADGKQVNQVVRTLLNV